MSTPRRQHHERPTAALYDGRRLIAIVEHHADGWHVKDAKGADLGTFPTREFAIAFINASIKRPPVKAASVSRRRRTGGSGMQTKRIPKPIFRSKMARLRRVTRKAERKRQRERERYAAEYAAYEARQPELIKKEKMEGGRD
jgi:hypothetical protein